MKNILHEQSSATATGSSSDAGAGKSARFDDAHQQLAKQHGGESSAHPHHLKYGKVDVGGFEPAELDGDESLSPLKQNPNDEQQSHHDERQRQKMHRDHTCELLDAEARRIHASRRYLLRTPRPQQYFRGSVLVRSHEERSSDKLELFFDLVFVGIISVLAQSAVERATGYALLEYVIVYSMAYTIWCWMREMFNTFFKDDLYQGLLTLFVMACLVLFGNNAINAEETLNSSELSTGRIMAVSAYLVAELAIFSTWFLYSFYIKPYRAQLRAHCIVWLFSTALWIGVIFVRDNAVIAMSIVALFLEWSAYLFIYSPVFKRTLKLRYSSAIAIEHEIERNQDFFTLVMGEFVFSLLSGNPAGTGFHAAAGKAILSLVIAYCFRTIYVNGGGSRQITHPLRHSATRAMFYLCLNLPIVCALTLCGDALADLVKENHVSNGIRWMSCGSYGVGMLGIWALAILEREEDKPGELWLPKWARLTPRFIAGVVGVLLPLTRQALPEEHGADEHGAEASAEGAAGEVPGGEASSLLSVVRRSTHYGVGEGVEGAMDINTIKLLAIMAAMAMFVMLWEIVTSLDGPNAEQEHMSESVRNRAKNAKYRGGVKTFDTPHWRGYPRCCEPGAFTFDWSHQREHSANVVSGE